MFKKFFYNYKKLTKFIFKKNKLNLIIWVSSVVFVTFLIANAFTTLFSSNDELLVLAETMKNPAMTAMLGPGYGLDSYKIGAMFSHEMLLFTAIAIAIMSILFVSKNTRNDEEKGRTEMIRSLPVGKISKLLSVNIVIVFSFIILSLLVGFSLYFLKLDNVSLIDGLLYGSVLGVTGILFASITSLFAQLTENSRGTLGLSFIFLGAFYILRAIGDVGNEVFSLISPLGLILRTQALVNNYWWPIFIVLFVSLIIYIIAFYLNSIRDLQAGFIPSRKGKDRANNLLLSKLGLPIYLSKGLFIGWVIALFLLGISYGSVFGEMENFIETNDIIQRMIQMDPNFSLIEQFVPVLMIVISIISTIPILSIIFKMKNEESKSRLDYIYSKKVSRKRIYLSYLVISFFSSIFLIFIAASGLFIASSISMDVYMPFKTLLFSAFAYLPAIWVMIGITLLLIGYFNRQTILAWLYLGFSFIVVYFGPLLQFPEFVNKLSPFGHVSRIPIEKFDLFNSLVLILVFISLVFIGLKGYEKRDIE